LGNESIDDLTWASKSRWERGTVESLDPVRDPGRSPSLRQVDVLRLMRSAS